MSTRDTLRAVKILLLAAVAQYSRASMLSATVGGEKIKKRNSLCVKRSAVSAANCPVTQGQHAARDSKSVPHHPNNAATVFIGKKSLLPSAFSGKKPKWV